MTRKVIKIGTSAGVTIPKDVLEELELRPGDEVEVFFDKDKKVVALEPKRRKGDDRNIKEWTEEFIDEYRDALKKLAE